MKKTKLKELYKLKTYSNYILLTAALIVFTVLELSGGLRRSHAHLMAVIGFSVILAVSLNLVVGFLGELSLGHAGFMCVGAYIGGLLAKQLTASMGNQTLALIISMIAGGLAAASIGILSIGITGLYEIADIIAHLSGQIKMTSDKRSPALMDGLKPEPEIYGME